MADEAGPPPKARRRSARERLPGTPDPVEIAMAAVASGKPLPDVARRVLEEQAGLIQAQRSEIRIRHVGETVRAALWGILALAALALIGVVIAIVVRAARSDALVVESFRVPPAIAARGLTGEVVATQVLDKLAEMQDGSTSTRAATSYANNWGEELKIDIPQTGASADQVWKLLRGWLGKETRITGEIVDTGAGLALTARVGSAPGRRFVSAESDLDALIAQGAELIYRDTQPYRYATYIGRDPQRWEERHQILQQLTGHESERERKWAYNGLGVHYRAQGDLETALAMAKKALEIDPKMIPAMGNLTAVYFIRGQDQRFVDTLDGQLALPTSDEYDPRTVKANQCRTRGQRGLITRDLTDLRWSAECYAQVSGPFAAAKINTEAAFALLTHDTAAQGAIRFVSGLGVSPDEAELYDAEFQARAGLLGRDQAALAQALNRFDKALATAIQPSAPSAAYHRMSLATVWRPLQAEALARLGRLDQASSVIAATPLDCYTCVRVRGLVAEQQGRPGSAARWFAAAVALGPRLAPAYADWGRLLVANKRFAAGQTKLKEAARLAPTWADPLKDLGDASAAQGRKGKALDHYDRALKLAPKWQELQQAAARARTR